MPSTITIQQVLNYASIHSELMPLAGVGGNSGEPALSLANDAMCELLAPAFPWKCNRKEMPVLVMQRGKQDYLFAGATAFTLDGDAKGCQIDLVTNNGITEVGFVVTVKTLEPHAIKVGDTVYMTGNSVAAYNSTFTQTPDSSAWSGGWTVTSVTSQTFVFTHASSGLATSGAPGITDFGSIEAASMTDPRQATSPQPRRIVQGVRMLEPMSAIQIPQFMCVVQDQQNGILKIRFTPLPGSTPWMVSPIYQAKAPLITSLSGTWTPFPDELAFVYRQMFLAKAYRYINSSRSEIEEQKAQMAIMKGLAKDDKELSEEYIVPQNPIDIGYGGMNTGAWWL